MRPHPMSELARMRADFTARGWNLTDLDAFRMEDGAGETGDTGEDGDSGDGDGGDSDGGAATGELGEAGKLTLDKERAKVKAAREALKPWNQLASTVGMTFDQIQEALTAKASGDNDPDKIRRAAELAAEATASAKANARIVRAEVKAVAAELFADPGDAHLYVDLAKYEVDDGGEVDVDEISTDLKAVLAVKPHLARNGRSVKPDLSQGSRGDKTAESTPGLGRMRDAYARTSNNKKK